MPVALPRGLYLLTPDRDDTAALLDDVEQALVAGIALLQYRNKSADGGQRSQQAHALRRLCTRHGVRLIVNDDVRLAREIAADGVHVGREDAAVAHARRTLGTGAIIGASCYDDLARAARATADGASYVAFGAFHPSPTKPRAPRATLALLRDAARLGLPRVAIGGITADNARPLIAAGAHLLAVISDVFDAPDIGAAVRRYHPLFEEVHDAPQP